MLTVLYNVGGPADSSFSACRVSGRLRQLPFAPVVGAKQRCRGSLPRCSKLGVVICVGVLTSQAAAIRRRLRQRVTCVASADGSHDTWGGVNWIDLSGPGSPESCAPDRLVLPVMPSAAVYLPSPSQNLMVSEARYRKMYDDILFSGGRRFVVACQRENRLAEVGVVFHVDDLRDVSESTNGRVKYAAEHSIIQRARILRLVNPDVWLDKSTYLRAEVELWDSVPVAKDDGGAAETAGLNVCRRTLAEVMALQQELKEELRFEEIGSLENFSFWSMCRLLVSLLATRLQLEVQALHAEVRDLTKAWVEDNPDGADALKVDFTMLPAYIRAKGDKAQAVYRTGSEKLQGRCQNLLQTLSLKDQCTVLLGLIEEERARLLAKRSLKDALRPEENGPDDNS